MGHAIEALAQGRGHEVVACIDAEGEWPARLDADVAIEFSTPATAAANVERCIDCGVAVVCGTTGWNADYDRVAAHCRAVGGRMLTASNFSVGMNIVFAINRRLAALMAPHPEYRVDISETHHVHKLDAPSGTALTLRDQIVDCGGRDAVQIPIESVREGEVAGIHTVRYASEADTITLCHEAHSRRGLAEGALLAAEWLTQAGAGVYTMQDVVG